MAKKHSNPSDTIVAIIRLRSILKFGTSHNITRKLLLLPTTSPPPPPPFPFLFNCLNPHRLPFSLANTTPSPYPENRRLRRNRLHVHDRGTRRDNLRLSPSDPIALQRRVPARLRHLARCRRDGLLVLLC